jgi:hypothetical protein
MADGSDAWACTLGSSAEKTALDGTNPHSGRKTRIVTSSQRR